jgi:hypothetical protein
VGYLDHDAPEVRAGAGWAITVVVDEHPDTAEYLARRLGDRLADADPPLAVERALDAVARRYPGVVESELDELADEREDADDRRSYGGSMLRANYHAQGPGERSVDRRRFSAGVGEDDPRLVYTPERGNQEDRVRQAGEKDGDDGQNGEDAAMEPDGEDAATEPDGEDGARSDDGSDAVDATPPGRELWAGTDHLRHIAEASRFKELHVTANRRHGRYGDVYRMRATVAGKGLPVALILFHLPREMEAFARDLDDALAQWNRVDDHEQVLTIHDWGLSPRPWALTEYAADSLRGDADRSVETAVWSGRVLASALAYAHERGVLHAGVDPGNVVFYGNLLAEEERRTPRFANVAILAAVRHYFDPTGLLDPRYAAPEYFDRTYGRVDHATDIYQLGAVLYRLLTGDHPYGGEYEAVRDAILHAGPPQPSEVADVPQALDDVVTKAMAREKLRRYESVTHLGAELRAIEAESDAT